MKKLNFVKNTTFFKTKFKDDFFDQTTQHNHLCTFNSLFMLQKSLGYAIKKFRRFYRVPEKIAIFKKIKKLQNLSHELEQRMFCPNLFLIQYFDSLCKDGKRNWVSTLLSSEMYGLSTGQGLTLSPMENYQVFL